MKNQNKNWGRKKIRGREFWVTEFMSPMHSYYEYEKYNNFESL